MSPLPLVPAALSLAPGRPGRVHVRVWRRTNLLPRNRPAHQRGRRQPRARPQLRGDGRGAPHDPRAHPRRHQRQARRARRLPDAARAGAARPRPEEQPRARVRRLRRRRGGGRGRGGDGADLGGVHGQGLRRAGLARHLVHASLLRDAHVDRARRGRGRGEHAALGARPLQGQGRRPAHLDHGACAPGAPDGSPAPTPCAPSAAPLAHPSACPRRARSHSQPSPRRAARAPLPSRRPS